MPKLGCIIRPEVKALHASLALQANLLLPAWSRVVGTPRILGHNDQIGDCACVAAVMAVQTHLARQGNLIAIPDDLAVQVYSAVTGYVPGNDSTDNGTDPEQLFAWWKTNGIAGYKLADFTRINPANINALRNSIAGAGGVYLCLELSQEQMTTKEWLPVGSPGSEGGHAVWGDSYEAQDIFVTSWGEEIGIKSTTFAAKGFVAMAYSLELNQL